MNIACMHVRPVYISVALSLFYFCTVTQLLVECFLPHVCVGIDDADNKEPLWNIRPVSLCLHLATAIQTIRPP